MHPTNADDKAPAWETWENVKCPLLPQLPGPNWPVVIDLIGTYL